MKRLDRRGMIMATVIVLLPIAIMLAVIALRSLTYESQFLQHEKRTGITFYMAEIGLNVGLHAYAATNYNNPTHDKTVQAVGASVQADPKAAGNVLATDLVLPAGLAPHLPFARVSSGPYQGWYEYKWSPSDGGQPRLNIQGLHESIRFRVSLLHQGMGGSHGAAHPRTWEVVSEATLGVSKKTHRLVGTLEGIFDHALFDNGSSNEFFRMHAQSFKGKVHANGDIFFKPNASLTFEPDSSGIDNFSVTAGSHFYRGMDAVGLTASLPNQRIKIASATGGLRDFTGQSSDSGFDAWADATFHGTVKDDAGKKTPPPVSGFEPSGFYANQAEAGGLRIKDNGGGSVVVHTGGADYPINSLPPSLNGKIKLRTIYNHSEMRNVAVVELNFNQNPGAKSHPSSSTTIPLGLNGSDYGNGLIYSDLPVALVNAQELPNPAGTTLVSQSSIYTYGDVNKEYTRDLYPGPGGTHAAPTNPKYGKPFTSEAEFNAYRSGGGPGGGPGPMAKKSVALMTKDRIWHVTKNFTPPANTGTVNGNSSQNNPRWNSAQPPAVATGKTSAQEPEEYPGDNKWINRDNGNSGDADSPAIEVNAALLDGAPLYSEPWNRKVVAGKPEQRWGPGGTDYPAQPSGSINSRGHQIQTSYDTFLEDFSARITVKKRGSIVHLQNGTMGNIGGASPYNSVPLSMVAWYRDSFYQPPTRDYGYDNSLQSVPPPFCPQISNRRSWSTL